MKVRAVLTAFYLSRRARKAGTLLSLAPTLKCKIRTVCEPEQEVGSRLICSKES